MKVTNEKTENRQAFLTIEMEPSEVNESMEQSYRRLVKKTRVPGFRKGKAPREILERHLGKEALFEDAVNNLLPQAYEKALEEQQIEAIARPQIEVAQTEPLVFKAIVSLKPEVKLGDYRQVRLTPEPVTMDEDNVDAVIEQLRHQRATWEPLERPIDFGDLVAFNVESTIDDEPFINQEGVQYQVLPELTFPVPGFAEQLTGMKKDEEKEFSLKFPSDYDRSELADKEPRFKVSITEIKQEILPEVNDEFASEVNPDFTTVDLLRERVSADLRLRAEEKARVEFEEQVLDVVVDLCEIDSPPILVDMEINRLLNQRFQRGQQELEEYLSNINKTEEELREEIRPMATKGVTRSLVLGEVVEEEKIEIDDAEIDAEIEHMKETATGDKNEMEKVLNTPQVRHSIEHTLISRKTVLLLVEIAKGSDENKIQQEEEK